MQACSRRGCSLIVERNQTPKSLAAAIQNFIDSSDPIKGQPIHAIIIKSGQPPVTNVSIKLLILHLRCGLLANARKVFDQMPKPTLSAFNYLISGYFKAGIAGESLDLVRKLACLGEKPDGFTLSMVLKLSSILVSFDIAKQTHTQIIKLEAGSDDVVFSALIDSYVKNGMIGYARRVLEALPRNSLVCSTSLIVGYMNEKSFRDAEEIFKCLVEKDVVVYNAMIEGYSKMMGTASKSFEVYKEMRVEGYNPTISTVLSVVGACSLLLALEFGHQLHCQFIKSSVYSHVKVGSALIDMYSKCGWVEDARRIFDHMPDKNVFSWTSMIDGYGKNGVPDEALRLFYHMRCSSEVKPNYTTFISVLSACGHAGFVSDGKEIFECIEKKYSMKPKMEHYACMVDILGRAGQLLEAHDFIKKIPEKPNSDVWAALLGASRVHGDVAMADTAANELFKLSKNERPGAYIALSNTFAAAGEWEGVCAVRDLMKKRRVPRIAGYSWVDTKDYLDSIMVRKAGKLP
ncbi:hypothetical protein HPP92_012369 [Vanilla planifolia]|uniref:Pentatricopeptide repeat-containing protein n=1 Tax=Vanilla planifolia TaxID=51239 RepID=A0A835V3A0_VANPL|nr:hypothetical protein HPP92_012369 [Vanilla planifolia]